MILTFNAAAFAGFLAFLVLTSMAAAPAAAEGWSDPSFIAETTVAAPPALVITNDTVHLFWLDREGTGPVALRHAILDADGRIIASPRTLAARADSRFGWPVAAVVGQQIFVVWMAREGDSVQLMTTLLRNDGTVLRPPSPVAPPAEESGRVAILSSGGAVHIAWSQFDHGERRVWYLRASPGGDIEVPPRAVAPGEAPALVPGAAVRMLWWSPMAIDTYRLVLADLVGGEASNLIPLTGTLLLPRAMPAIAVPSAGSLDVLLPVLERAFATTGRLYYVRVREGEASPRQLLPTGSVSDVTGFSSDSHALVTWSQATGRRRNSEVLAAVFDASNSQLSPPTRITFTPAGSIRPTIATTDAWRIAAWLEVTGITRFRVAVASTRHPRTMKILLGIPELDLYRPGQALGFAAAVLASTLPYALLFSIAFGLPALGLSFLAGAVFGSFGWWERLRARRRLRLYSFIALVAGVQVIGRVVIPGSPTAAMLLVSLFGAGLIALPATRTSWFRQELGFWVICGAVLAAQFLIVLFPWGMQQLSQY